MRPTAAWLNGLAAGAVLAAATALIAGPVGPLISFSSGTPAHANEVNANFTAVKSAVDDNAARLATVEACARRRQRPARDVHGDEGERAQE